MQQGNNKATWDYQTKSIFICGRPLTCCILLLLLLFLRDSCLVENHTQNTHTESTAAAPLYKKKTTTTALCLFVGTNTSNISKTTIPFSFFSFFAFVVCCAVNSSTTVRFAWQWAVIIFPHYILFPFPQLRTAPFLVIHFSYLLPTRK